MANEIKNKRIAELIRRELGMLFLKQKWHPIFDKITVVAVKMSKNLDIADVYYILLEEAKIPEVKLLLKNESKFLRKNLAKNLNLRFTPKLNFIYDNSVKKSMYLSELIDKAIKFNIK